MASINTNYGASIALQNLNKTNSELERTQNRINTGIKNAYVFPLPVDAQINPSFEFSFSSR